MSVMDVQHGGNHYKGVPAGFQPIEIAETLGLSATEFSILKYLLRYAKKNGLEDLKKMMHFGQILIKTRYGVDSTLTYAETATEAKDAWDAVAAGIPDAKSLKEAVDALQAKKPDVTVWNMPDVAMLFTPIVQPSVQDEKDALCKALGVDPVYVTQDRVPARALIDEYRWSHWTNKDEWSLVERCHAVCGKMHGYKEEDDVISVRCRPEDLPAIQNQGEMKPDLDGWADTPVKKGGPADHLLPEKKDYPGPTIGEVVDFLNADPAVRLGAPFGEFPSVMDDLPF